MAPAGWTVIVVRIYGSSSVPEPGTDGLITMLSGSGSTSLFTESFNSNPVTLYETLLRLTSSKSVSWNSIHEILCFNEVGLAVAVYE